MAPALLRPLLDLLLLRLTLLQLGLFLPALEFLLHPDPGLLPDGCHAAVFHGMAIIKAFPMVPFIARLPVEPLLTGTNGRLPVKATPNGPFLRAPVVRRRAELELIGHVFSRHDDMRMHVLPARFSGAFVVHLGVEKDVRCSQPFVEVSRTSRHQLLAEIVLERLRLPCLRVSQVPQFLFRGAHRNGVELGIGLAQLRLVVVQPVDHLLASNMIPILVKERLRRLPLLQPFQILVLQVIDQGGAAAGIGVGPAAAPGDLDVHGRPPYSLKPW